jgi:hypothetical protein
LVSRITRDTQLPWLLLLLLVVQRLAQRHDIIRGCCTQLLVLQPGPLLFAAWQLVSNFIVLLVLW